MSTLNLINQFSYYIFSVVGLLVSSHIKGKCKVLQSGFHLLMPCVHYAIYIEHGQKDLQPK